MLDAFYVTSDGAFHSTELTRGPWDPGLQHAGPPAALIARALEADSDGWQVVRFGVDLLKPVPISPLWIEVDTRTPGKRRQIREGILRDQNAVLARAQALLLRTSAVALPATPVHDPAQPPAHTDAEPFQFAFTTGERGYHTAMEMRRVAGGPGSGHAQMWMRQRVPLVDSEVPSTLQRVMLIADSGNGVSSVLDWQAFRFTNPDLSVNLRRHSNEQWFCLDAHTHMQPLGLGMAESRIWDSHGVVANGTQNLLIEAARS